MSYLDELAASLNEAAFADQDDAEPPNRHAEMRSAAQAIIKLKSALSLSRQAVEKMRRALEQAQTDFADIDKCALLSVARDIATDGLSNVTAALSSLPEGERG